jgi:hypothetical protein
MPLLLAGCTLPVKSESARALIEHSHCALVYQSNWSSGIDPQLRAEALSGALKTVPSAEYGGVVLRARMNRNDDFTHVANGVPRAEINFSPVAHLVNEHDYWIIWSTMMDKDYHIDMVQPEIISQIHQSSRSPGSPPFSLMLAGAQYQVDIRGGRGTPSVSIKFGNPIDDRGRFIFWRLHYRPDHDGLYSVTDLYKDGIKVVHEDGLPNAYVGEGVGYFKIGIYKWWWLTRPSNVIERQMNYGDIDIKECVVVGEARK